MFQISKLPEAHCVAKENGLLNAAESLYTDEMYMCFFAYYALYPTVEAVNEISITPTDF